MPNNKYVLKNEITSSAKINRLLKTINVNAKEDRDEAQKLLAAAKEALEALQSPIEQNRETGTTYVDSFVKLLNAATLALNQAGNANEKLLKLASLLQKFNSESKKNGNAGVSLNGSLFKTIEDLANKGQSDD